MIHRIDRVNPDVDDRVIKPNEARMATNLRFGASVEDTNLSGGTLILGNRELTAFVAPGGTNRVVGVYSDLESRNVFFAMWNSGGEHGIYRISGDTDVVEPVIRGSILNFQGGDEYNVSITGIDGKLYWTDNVNQPRMINVAKGIRTEADGTDDVYPLAIQEWMITQIKRPPGVALTVTPQIENAFDAVSQTKQNRAINATGVQYSYYYVYDNYEESRLAPFTINTFGNLNIFLTIEDTEFVPYASQRSLIKAIVLVIRNGNDGVWRELKYFINDGVTRQFFFSNILAITKPTVATDIVDARFDSVPLVSKTNTIAQNKINHGNYVLDYEDKGDVSFKCDIYNYQKYVAEYEINNVDIQNINLSNKWREINNSFVPWGRYTFGIEYVDRYGRTIPVNNFVERFADAYAGGSKIISYSEQNTNGYSITVFTDKVSINPGEAFIQSGNSPGQSIAIFELSGRIPDWAEKINIVRSKCLNIVSFNQSAGYMYLWYTNAQGADEFIEFVPYALNVEYQGPLESQISQNLNLIIPGKTFQGYVVKFNSGEPFVQKENQYLYIKTQYRPQAGFPQENRTVQNTFYQDNVIRTFSNYFKFKVEKIVGNGIFISTKEAAIVHPLYSNVVGNSGQTLNPMTFPVAEFVGTGIGYSPAGDKIENFLPLLYNFVLTEEGEFGDGSVYTTQTTITRDQYQAQIIANGRYVGGLEGDAKICLSVKNYDTEEVDVVIYNPGKPNPPRDPVTTLTKQILPGKDKPPKGYFGYFISMNPVDIYLPEWNQNIGQSNVINTNPEVIKRSINSICFSGSLTQGTQINGINKFNSLDFRLAPAENGPITALVTTNATQREPGVLLAIGEIGVSSFYYNAIQLTNVDGSANVTTTDAYLASQRPLLGQYGCKRPMSVTNTPLGTVYWWSDVVNDLIRYTNAGLERLGLTFSFGNHLRIQYNDNPFIITWYDQVTDEIQLMGTGKNTSVFSERYKTFQGVREYFTSGGLYPDRATGLPTKHFIFVGGRVFVSDVDAIGVQDNFLLDSLKNPSLNIVTNESPAIVKQWNQVKVFGPRPDSVTLMAAQEDGTSLGSVIPSKYFIQRKGDWDAAIRRAGQTEAEMLSGKVMESRIIYSKFAFSAADFPKLNFIEVKSNSSIVQ
jgi:hypothetical protein